MIINVQIVRVHTDPPTAVYAVVVLDDTEKASWNETVNTEIELKALFRGIRLTFAMMNGGKLLPDAGKDALVRFAPNSYIQTLIF